MALTGLHLAGSYKDDRDFGLKVSENNPLRKGEDLSGLRAHLDKKNSLAIGYGFDLLVPVHTNDVISNYLATISSDAWSSFTANDELLLDQLRGLRNKLTDAEKKNPPTDYLQKLAEVQSQLSLNLYFEKNASDLLRLMLDNEYEPIVRDRLSQYGMTLPECKERAVLVSLAYQTPKYLGNGLMTAMQNDDRAEAWFEIRYNSNTEPAGIADGVAKRHYYEADLFGLYDDGVNPASGSGMNDENALGAFRVYTRHKAKIDKYESQFAPQVANAKRDFETNIVLSLKDDLQPARNYLIQTYDTNKNFGIDITGNILVGEHNGSTNTSGVGPTDTFDTRYYRRNIAGADNDILIGSLGNDLIFGESGDDVLYGLGGSDVLYGGAGNDVYHVINGVSLERNQTRIEDKEGINTVVMNGVAFKFFVKKDGQTGFYETPDQRFRGEYQGSDFLVTDTEIGNSVILNENFEEGDFGIQLVDRQSFTATNPNTTPLDGPATDYGDFSGNTAPDGSTLHTLRGTTGDDDFDALGGNDWLEGYGGNDHLFGNRGDDKIDGGDGNDRLEGGADSDIMIGGLGDDELYGDTRTDLAVLLNTPGNDTATGNRGDWLTGGLGQDIVVGTQDNDVLFGGGGNDILAGGAGDDDLNGDDNYLAGATWRNSDLDFLPVGRSNGDTLALVSGGSVIVTDSAALVGGADALYGGGGNDRLWGMAGDDTLNGGEGRDILMGGAGNDTLIGGPDDATDSADALLGGAGDDWLQGGGGDDYLAGGEGHDVLEGGAGNDWLRGAAIVAPTTRNWSISLNGGVLLHNNFGAFRDDQLIADVIEPNGDNFYLFDSDGVGDDLFGGDGNDTLLGGAGDDALYGEADNDALNGGAGSDLLDGGTGDDLLAAGFGSDVLYGGDGNDVLYGDADYASAWGVSGIDGDDYLDGGAGNDMLYGYGGDDILMGGAGDDVLAGGAGADILDGGDGNDTIYLDGQDTLIRSAGADTVYWVDPVVATNRPVIDVSDLAVGSVDVSQLSYLSASMVLDFGNGDRLTFNGGFLDGGQVYQFEDTTLTQQQLMQLFHTGISVVGTNGADTIYGSNQNDILYGYGAGGNYQSADGNDILDGQGGDDILEGGLGDDTLMGGDGNDNLRAHAGNDILLGGTGDDRLYGFEGNDILDGGAGNDSLWGDQGNDTYRFGRSSGQDTITEYDSTGTDIDTVVLEAGILPTDVTFLRNGNDLILALDQGPTQLTVTNYFLASAPNSACYKIERLVFANGTVWTGTDIAARVPSTSVDAFTGTAGNDSYVVDNTLDTVTEGLNAGTDTIFSSVTYALPGNVENLTLTGYFDIAGNGNALNNIIVGNSGNNVLNGSGVFSTSEDGMDILRGGDGDDTYVLNYSGPYTFDSVEELANQGTDTVLLQSNYSYGRYVLSDNVENLSFRGSNLYTLVTSQWYLVGNALDNIIISDNSGANLDGGLGADTMIGGGGNDVYWVDNPGDVVIETGADFDTVNSTISYTLPELVEQLVLLGADSIRGTGNKYANVLDGSQNTAANVLAGGGGNDTYIVDGGDVVLENANDGVDEVRIVSGASQTYTLDAYANVENLTLGEALLASNATGNSGDNTLRGNGFDNVLTGGAGNDTLIGKDGNDTYVFGIGAGRDTVQDGGGSYSFQDAIQFDSSVRAGDILLTRSGDDLLINLRGTSDQVTVTGQFSAGAYNAIELINFSDGTVWDQAAVDARIAGNNTNTATEGADTVVGTAADDVLSGLGGDDTVSGGAGNDLLDGGLGNDTLFGNDGNDSLYGGEGDDRLYGNTGDDSLYGGAGLDVLQGNEGNDMLAGEAGNDLLDGGDGNDTLLGGDGNDELHGGLGNDIIDGGAGDDYLYGGAGNDVYRFGRGAGQDWLYDSDATAGNLDTIEIAPGVLSSEITVERVNSYDLVLKINGTTDQLTIYQFFYTDAGSPTQFQIEQVRFADGTVWDAATLAYLSTRVNGTAGNDVLVGSEGDDRIYGFAGNDTLYGDLGNDLLDGGTGSDTMVGGLGDDTYVVDVSTDVVTEYAGEGVDTVQSSITYTLGSNVENLVLTGNSAINGTGNGLANVLTGNDAANTLSGGSGNDTLYGLGGNDTLNGGSGADTMAGGLGNDTYVVDNLSDVVLENAGEGTDLVQSAVTYTLSANVENLTLTGTSAINATGNNLDNVLTGNSANNTLYGYAGNDTLDGGSGSDTMIGGTGNDTYVVNATGDVVTENANEGIDTVKSSITYTLGNNVENLTLTGTTAINGTGNSLNNVLTGNSANNILTGGAGDDVLDGGAGSDTMKGGTGNDTYFVNISTDVVTENANEGTDTVLSSITYTLGNNVENLNLTGTTAINGTGNSLNNVLIGNSANNTLTGNAGNDILDGGAGNDTLVGGTGNDIYVFNRGYGQDKVTENDTTAGNSDIAQIGTSALDLVLARNGSNLVMSLHGGTDTLTINNWYSGSQYQTEIIRVSDGLQLLNTQVDQLIQAMAQFSASTGLSWDQAITQRPDEVQAILAAYWQTAA